MNLATAAPSRYHFQSRRPHEAHGVIATLFEPQFRLEVPERADFQFRLDHFPCGPGVSISRLAFNADVAVQIDRVDAFMVQMPLAGSNELHLDGPRAMRLSVHKRLFSVIGPKYSLRQRRSPDCKMVLVRFNAAEMAQCLAAHIGEAVAPNELAGLEFGVEMPGYQGYASPWLRLTSYLLGELDKETSLFLSPLAASQTGQLLMSTLLLHQPHTYSNLLRMPADQVSARFIREADDFLHRNAHLPVTADDLARHLRVSTRSVHAGFRRYLATTPLERLKEIRLQRVRDDLLAADDRSSVTTIAMKWGFTHLGKFSSDYRSRFGELPSQTLRASKAAR